MARLSREMIVTEKIDGTNACIHIGEDGEFLTGSRSKWITPDCDNHGFSRWATEQKEELLGLGIGTHFGEWWGSGIQRGYELPKGEKRFSLFNVQRWCLNGQVPQRIPCSDPRIEKFQEVAPACCHIIPELYRGDFFSGMPEVVACLDRLEINGSKAAPGFMKPEGVVVWHVAGNFGLKKTLEKDARPKGM